METPFDKPRRKPWRRRALALAGVALGIGAIGLSLGPAAPWIVDHVSDGQKIGRLGRLRVDGVTGSWAGDLRARHLAIEDEHGIWLEGRNVAVRWDPIGLLLGGATRIYSAEADALSIARRPELGEAKPPHSVEFHIDIDAVRIAHLTVEEPLFGARGEFSATAALDVTNKGVDALDLNLQRLDSDADRAVAHYRGGEAFALHVDVASAPGGVLARALGAPDKALAIAADGAGHDETGAAHFTATLGEEQLGAGEMSWDAARWTLHGDARFEVMPGVEAFTQRIGGSVAMEAQGERRGAFTAHAQTPLLALDVAGRLKDGLALDGPAHIVAETPRLSAIAHEAPFEFGAARFEGTFRHDGDDSSIDGQLDARDLEILARRAHMSGPLRARLAPSRFELSADLQAADNSPPLFAHARLQTQLAYDRDAGRFTLSTANVNGDAIAIDARGWAQASDGEFSGQWRLKQLGTLFDGMSGEAGGRWRAFSQRNGEGPRVWSAAVDGQGANVGGSPEIVAQLLGRNPRLDGLFHFERTGIRFDHARIDGAQLRAAATGRVVHGDADLDLEATARGPLTIGDAEIGGAVDATGHLSGRIVRPTLTAHAQLASFTAVGVEVTQPDVTFTLAPAGNSYRGQAQMQGRYGTQVVSATSGVVVANNTLALPELTARIAALEARGEASFSPRGANAQLALSGALDGLAEGLSGRVQGNAALTPQTVNIDAQIADAHAGDLRVRAATLTASGPYRAIEAHFDMRGALRRAPLTFAGTATMQALPRETTLNIEGHGALAGAAITTRAPIVARWTDNGLDASLDMALADGGLTAHWRERARVLQGAATIGETPIAPLAAIWGERATGRVKGEFELTNTGGGLSGDARVMLIDARFAGRQRGAINGGVTAHLEPTRLTATFDSNSADGLVAHLDADAPVVTSASPIRIALAPDRRGHASWSVRGPAGALWTAARLPDQDLEGDLSGEGQITFGAGYLAGDGRIEIAHGRFEDKVSGVKLQDLDAALAIHQDGLTIERFTAADSRGGRITATGGSANPEEGRIQLQLHDLRLVDRPDANARASGSLDFAWHGRDATVTGDLAIAEANVSITQNPEAGIPTLDVVEINRPGDDFEEEAPARQALGQTRLDIRINAPGRVFTRGRGVEAEWALNIRLGGTSAAPLVYGEAQTLRGTLSLSGQPFEIDDGHIYFNGATQDARVNLTATRDTADLTAHARLTGTAANPDITFTSDPALPEDEILPQILFGHSIQDLNALEAAQLAASLAALSGQASFSLVDAARAAAGLDRFNVRQDTNGGFLVAGGVYLTREVYVEVARTGLGQASTRVEWTIRPKLVMITSFLTNGDQRVSLRWRRESN